MIVNDAQYEITAHHTGGEFHATGDTVVAVETETVDTYIDLVPSFNMSSYNYMERMWAYLSVHALLRRVERGELYSCAPEPRQASYQVCAVLCILHHVRTGASEELARCQAGTKTLISQAPSC